jgi:hypothetical protein
MNTNQINTRIVLVNKNNEDSINTADKVIELSNANKSEEQIEIVTENLYEGEYIAILMAEVNGEMTPLDAAGVTLNEHKYELTVTAGDGGCVSDVSGEYKSGEVVTVKASSEDGFVFDRWESDDIVFESDQINTSEVKIVMPRKRVSIKAVFVEKKDTIGGNEEQDNNGTVGNTTEGIDADNSDGNIAIKKDSRKEIETVPNKNDDKGSNRVINNRDKLSEPDEGGNKLLISPITGDFVTRDNIRIMLLVQSVALIVICVALKNKEQKEKGDKSCR